VGAADHAVLAPSDLVTTTRKLSYYIFFTDTLGPQTNAEIRKGAPGLAGPPIASLSVGNPISGTVSLTSTADLASGQLYVNIGTAPHSDGELRGQILPGGCCFTATLAGADETPPNSSTATGSGLFTLSRTSAMTSTLGYVISYSSTLTATLAHIHKAPPGVSSVPVIPFQVSRPISGIATLTNQQVIDLFSGLYYANIHSTRYIQGEIRGQLVPVGCASTYLPVARR